MDNNDIHWYIEDFRNAEKSWYFNHVIYPKYNETENEIQLNNLSIYDYIIEQYNPDHLKLLSFNKQKRRRITDRRIDNTILDDKHNILIECMKKISMPLEEFKSFRYTEIKHDNTTLYIWKQFRIYELFKLVSLHLNYVGKPKDFILVDVHWEILPFFEFGLANSDTIINNKTNKQIIKIVPDINDDNFIVAYVDVIEYTKNIIEKYKTSNEILKHLIKVNEMFININ